MADEELATEQVDDTVSPEAGADSETQETEQVTETEETQEQTFTEAQVKEKITEAIEKKSARIKRQLQREFEETKKEAPSKETKVEGKPKLDDFESTEDWVEALADWKVEQKQKMTAQEAEAARQQEETNKIIKAFDRKTAKFEQTHPDFQDVMDDLKDYTIPGYIMEAVMTSDLGPDVAYFLGQNQEELENILDKSPAAAVRAIGRLEVKLEKSSEPIEKTKAPAPLKTLKGTGTVEETTYNKGDDFDKFLDTRYQELGRGRRQR
jgi:hypothetical protein